MAKNDYTYAVARIRAREGKLLSASFLEQLVSAPDCDSCIRLLREKGWGDKDGEAPFELLSKERERLWELMEELVGDLSVFNVFLYGNDYHNLKAAIKETCMDVHLPGIYISHGTVDPEVIQTAVSKKLFSELPSTMQTPARTAYETLLTTHDGQLCDVILDRAALTAVYQAGKNSGNEFLALYGELTVAAADIKIAYRALRTGKEPDFLTQALVPCDSLDLPSLIEASGKGRKGLSEYLKTTAYGKGTDALDVSCSAFERWCDNLLIQRIRPQLHVPFGLGPLAAYILARENEIKSVRIILSGKINHLPEESLRERVRETYV